MSGSALSPHGFNPRERRIRFVTKGVQRGIGRSPFPSGGVIHKRATVVLLCAVRAGQIPNPNDRFGQMKPSAAYTYAGQINQFENVSDVFFLICAEGTTSLAEGELLFRSREYFTFHEVKNFTLSMYRADFVRTFCLVLPHSSYFPHLQYFCFIRLSIRFFSRERRTQDEIFMRTITPTATAATAMT